MMARNCENCGIPMINDADTLCPVCQDEDEENTVKDEKATEFVL